MEEEVLEEVVLEVEELKAVFKFLLELLGRAHEVSFGYGELAHTDESVHFAAVLIAEKSRRFVVSQRKITVGTRTVEIRLILEGTGHWAQRVAFLCFVVRVAHDEHAVAIVIPVS